MKDQMPNPYPAEAVAELPISAARQELLEEIMATTDEEMLDHTASSYKGLRYRSWTGAAVAAAAVAALVAAPLALGGDPDRAPAPGNGNSGGPTTSPTDSPKLNLPTRVAGERVILAAEGWTLGEDMSESDGRKGRSNESTWERDSDGRQVEVTWRSASFYDETVAFFNQYFSTDEPSMETPIAGGVGKLWLKNRSFSAMTPIVGDYYASVRGDGFSEDEVLALLDGLRAVSEAEYVAALPEKVVTPAESSATIREVLADVPLPAGFTPDSVKSPGYNTPDRVTTRATDAVMCAWVTQWRDALADGDSAAKQEAVDAMAGSDKWDALSGIPPHSGYYWSVEHTAQVAAQLASPAKPIDEIVEMGCPGP